MNPAPPVTVSTAASPDSGGDPFADAVTGTSLRERLRVPDQAMAVGAAVLLPLGLAMVMMSWYGAARTPYLFEQVPYLISGGLLGLGFVMTGGFVLFGSWIARTAREQRALSQELLEAVRAVRDEVAAQPAPEVVPAQSRRRGGSSNGSTANGNGAAHGGLVATANGSMLHRSDCVVVANRDGVHAVSSQESGALRPCRLCDPLSATARV